MNTEQGTVQEVEGEPRGTFCARRMMAALSSAFEESDAETLLENALADLRHFADANELSFADADKKAQAMYAQEVHDDRAAKSHTV